MADSERVWWIENGKLGIGMYSNTTGKIVSVDESKVVRIHARYHPAEFGSTLTDSPTLPEELHEALVSRVLEKLYARAGNLELARYWRAEYSGYVRAGIIYRNRNRDDTQYFIKQHDM